LYRPGAYLARLVYVQQCKKNNINDFYEEHIWNLYYGKCNIWIYAGGYICGTVVHILLKV